MSLKKTLKSYSDTMLGPGCHLYENVLDDSGDVHLELYGVRFEARAALNGTWVDVTIPRAWAEALGLVKPEV